MIKAVILGASALALTAAPVAASAAPVAAPTAASKLSLSSATRAGASSGKSDRLGGAGVGPIAAIAILAGIAVGGYFIIDAHDDDSDSN